MVEDRQMGVDCAVILLFYPGGLHCMFAVRHAFLRRGLQEAGSCCCYR